MEQSIQCRANGHSPVVTSYQLLLAEKGSAWCKVSRVISKDQGRRCWENKSDCFVLLWRND